MKVALQNSKVVNPAPNEIFPRIANERGAVWLDSSLRIRDKGRYSYLACRPKQEIAAKVSNFDSVLSELSRIWNNKNLFSIGYFSYESALPFVGVFSAEQPDNSMPLIHFFVYDSVLQFDNLTGEYRATNPAEYDYSDLFEEEPEFAAHIDSTPVISPTVSKENYFRNVLAIKRHIREGDIYQANYTCRFDVKSDLLPFQVYKNLRKLNPAPYAAFLNFGDYHIISSSPERMFQRAGENITTCPIKGTISSGNSSMEQEQQKIKLLNSSKDKAELLMIVDLMRNDLGKIARTGSVKVDSLFSAEEYSSVIHLVSDISARLKSGTDYREIIAALLPGGSITGAPKKSAIEILQRFESTPRGVYTGCIGYVYGDTADFNIAIRTMVYRGGKYFVHAGGGIVADSDPESEYQEMQLKAKNLFKALGAKID